MNRETGQKFEGGSDREPMRSDFFKRLNSIEQRRLSAGPADADKLEAKRREVWADATDNDLREYAWQEFAEREDPSGVSEVSHSFEEYLDLAIQQRESCRRVVGLSNLSGKTKGPAAELHGEGLAMLHRLEGPHADQEIARDLHMEAKKMGLPDLPPKYPGSPDSPKKAA